MWACWPCEGNGNIKVGDFLLSINGISTERMDIEHVRDMLDFAASGVVSQEILCGKHRGLFFEVNSQRMSRSLKVRSKS